jgi:hypothetical protein
MILGDGSGGRGGVVTGANQGLGLALVAGLRRPLVPPDVLYLTRGHHVGRLPVLFAVGTA